MEKYITKLTLLFSGLALSFGLLIGIKPNNIGSVNAETTSRCGVEAEWEEWTSTTSLPTSGYYYLGNNVTITSNNITLSDTVLHLDLNGNTVSFEYEGDDSDNAITLSRSSEFSLYDSIGTGAIERKNTANYERFIYLERSDVIFNLNGGTIRNFKNSSNDSYGGAINIYYGNFNMTGGAITDCEAAYGGAVFVDEGGKVNFSGGEIFNNTSTIGNGGAVLSLGGTVKISGSLYVHNNDAHNGAGGGFYSGFGIKSGRTPFLIFDGGFVRDNMSYSGCVNIDKDAGPTSSVNILSGRFDASGNPALMYCENLESKQSNITFDKNGGTGGTDSLSFVKWGTNLTKIEVPTYVGHTFLGYFDQYGAKYFDALGRPTNKETSSIKWDYVGDQTLYAKWSANTYRVTLDFQGGTGGTDSVIANYGDSMPSATMPTKEGYTFLGYFDETLGGNKYYNADSSSAKNWDKDSNATLYARWEFIGVDTGMKLAYNYVNTPNSSNIFRLMCAVDVDIENLKATHSAKEAGIYIEKNGSYVARFDFINSKVYFANGTSEDEASIYVEENYKYVLIDLGDLIGDDRTNVNAVYTIHSYLGYETRIDIASKQTSYSFARLLNAYLDMDVYKDNASLKQCKIDLGLN